MKYHSKENFKCQNIEMQKAATRCRQWLLFEQRKRERIDKLEEERGEEGEIRKGK